MNGPTRNCPGPVSRRSFLQTGALGLGGLSLADVMRMRAQAGTLGNDPDTSVIFIWMPGGPPHMEMYDMKPDAPVDYRGEFKPIKTNVSGIDVFELKPLHAQLADKFSCRCTPSWPTSSRWSDPSRTTSPITAVATSDS
jgi:hypothetical protein